jgi:hypothetical protein
MGILRQAIDGAIIAPSGAELKLMRKLLFVYLAAFAFLSTHPCVAQDPGPLPYHQWIEVGQDGNPLFHFTNDSDLPIIALVMVEFPSLGMEGRTYLDVDTTPVRTLRGVPIPPGASITLGLSHFHGAESKVRAEVRAVIFQDGSSAGDSVWANAILARRLRFYDCRLSLHELLRQQVGTGISREGVLNVLRTAQADADKQLPEGDLRVIDDNAFVGAINTFEANRETKIDLVLHAYLKSLEQETTELERSRPSLEWIRARLAARPDPDQPIIPPLRHQN